MGNGSYESTRSGSISLFFPAEADSYYEAVIAYEEEKERRQEELDDKIEAYIDSLTVDELRQTVYALLYDGGEDLFERFVQGHIDY